MRYVFSYAVRVLRRVKSALEKRSPPPAQTAIDLSAQIEHITCLDMLQKRNALLAQKESITTLAIGSSHGDYAFEASVFPGSFNICAPSQDLRHSLLVYDYVAPHLPHLSDIVLFYSHFSPRFCLAKCGEKIRCAAYKEIFNLDIDYEDPEIEAAYQKLAGTYQARQDLPQEAPDPTQERFYLRGMTGEDRAKQHLPNTSIGDPEKPFDLQYPELISFIEQVKKNGHKLTIVLAPIRSDLRAALPSKDILFEKIKELHTSGDYDFTVLDFYEAHPDEEFGDTDHLLNTGPGPQTLTKRIFEALHAKD